MALPYPTKVVLPFDIATAQDMNERHSNDVALAAGTGLDDGAVTPDKLNDTGWITASINTTLFATYDTGTDVKYRRKGSVVEIVGAVKLTSAGVSSVGASAQPGFTLLMTLPAGFAPTSASYEQHTLAQSSGLGTANWAIKPNGEVGVERIVGTINTTNWLPVNLKCNAS